MWQITQELVADVMFTSGDRFEYLVIAEELDDAKSKMRNGLGSLEWQPDFGSRTDAREILNVRSIARIKPTTRANYLNVLVQLWCNPESGRLYLVDPDDDGHAWCLDGEKLGPHPEFPDEPYGFGADAWNLVETNLTPPQVGIPVSRPPADEVTWQLIAEYRGENRGVTLVVPVEELNGPALTYLARTVSDLAPVA